MGRPAVPHVHQSDQKSPKIRFRAVAMSVIFTRWIKPTGSEPKKLQLTS